MFAVIGKKISDRLNAYSDFTTVNGSNRVYPVFVPDGASYPNTIYEITNVTDFMSKGSALKSVDVSIEFTCFASDYNTTYNQAKALVEALSLYSVTYTEDGQSYTAKFRFETLRDGYVKVNEKFYKEVNFNCLIIKN